MIAIRKERRSRKFIEQLSCTLVWFSGLGALLVLVDPVITLVLTNGTTITLGGKGFSDQFKGAVVTLILVAGFTAVTGYWLGAAHHQVPPLSNREDENADEAVK